MSWQALNWATLTPVGGPNRKLVLLVLANYADMSNATCFPSQERLARETELGVRTVRRVLAGLEADGYIRREKRWRPGGGRTSDLIHLCIPANLAAMGGGIPANGDRHTGQSLAGEPSVEPPCDLHLARETHEEPYPGFEEQASQARRLAALYRAPGGLREVVDEPQAE